MSNLVNGRVILKSNDSVLVLKCFASLYINFILNLYIAYELCNWPHNPTNNFTLKNCLFGTVRNAIKSKSTYDGQGIAFDGERSWSADNDYSTNVVIQKVTL